MTFDSLLIYVQFERTGCVQKLTKRRINCDNVYSMIKSALESHGLPYVPHGRHQDWPCDS